MRKEFRSLISLDEARSIVLARLPRTEALVADLGAALGRVLDERIVSQIDVPGFDRASMDGYAVRASDTVDAREDRPLALKLVGMVPMGEKPEISVGQGEAAEVSTGSMMPPGADAVMMIEYAQADGGQVQVRRPVHTGENVLRAGSDIMFGDTVLAAGTRLTAREIGVLAAVGRENVRVRSLKVGIASTGNELVVPGDALGPGKVYDINSYSISAAVQECGATPVRYGILPDDSQAMEDRLKKIAEECAMTVVSGSTSAGAGDMLYRVVEGMGDLVFHGINLKPGKPTIYGIISDKPFFGMPGYPTSALTVFGQIVAPVIRTTLGIDQPAIRAWGVLSHPVRSESRHQMLPVGLSGDLVYPADRGSGSITTLAQADGVIEIPADVEYLDKGEKVRVDLFGEFAAPDMIICSESDPVLEQISETLPFRIRLMNVGSRRALTYLEDGVADIACISGLKEAPNGAALVRGYRRELGLMSRDPELLDLDTRALEKKRIIGWHRDFEMSRIFASTMGKFRASSTARSHSAVAAAIASGRADLGFGTMYAADHAGLCFRKMAEDEIDFLIRPARLDSRQVKSFIAALKANRFPPGTKPCPEIGQVILTART
ncbi:MAG TPA: molybdopterin biosynthesis protein [Methanotrichaceae archaeon]|nr:molybdopterin biosynthesis protein [Methanotrichaceae archaeon]